MQKEARGVGVKSSKKNPIGSKGEFLCKTKNRSQEIYNITIFIIWIFKVPQKFISWASRKIKISGCNFFDTNNGRDSL